jgi:hypothetical protein
MKFPDEAEEVQAAIDYSDRLDRPHYIQDEAANGFRKGVSWLRSRMEKERDEQMEIAVAALEKLRDGPGNKMVSWRMTWVARFAHEALERLKT